MRSNARRAGTSLAFAAFVNVLIGLGACAPARESDHGASIQVASTTTLAGMPGPIDPSFSRFIPGPQVPQLAPEVFDRVVERNQATAVSLPEALLAKNIAAWRHEPIGQRVARWARLFVDRRDNTYLFGVKPGGYVAESLLVQDFKLDCVSLFYRCTELARAGSPREALAWAVTTRFAGGCPTCAVSTTGAVNYDDPSHLDYSLDIVRSGFWGRDVTRDVGEAVLDTAGSSRFAPKTFYYIPTAKLRTDRLRDGDLLFFVLDENTERGRKLRRDVGICIGHQAICHVEKGQAYSIHSASKPLPGEYEGNRVVQVPVLTYLRRVEHFKGLIVTRLDDSKPSWHPVSCDVTMSLSENPAAQELRLRYVELANALLNRDYGAFQALRTPGFTTRNEKGELQTAEQMAARAKTLFEGMQRPVDVHFSIQAVEPRGGTAIATVQQWFSRKQTLAGQLRQLSTSARQRETWVRTPEGWKLNYVDDVQPLVWTVDGKRIDPSRPYDPDAPAYEPGVVSGSR